MTAEIVTERLRLRPFQVEDLEAFVAYRSDPEVARYQSWDVIYSMTDAQSFLTSQPQTEFGQPGEWLQLAIVDRRTGRLCGDCAVRVEIDPPATAEVGVTLARSRQSKGLATEALGAVVAALFEQQGMHRVFAEADDRNAPVKRLLERLGFRREARLVEADWFKGEWSTLCVYAILDREWQTRRNAGPRSQPKD
jgi:RimJ/RimL family protein N-acetyltransferase